MKNKSKGFCKFVQTFILIGSLFMIMIPTGLAQASNPTPPIPRMEDNTSPEYEGTPRGPVLLKKALQHEQQSNRRLSKLLEKMGKAVTRLEDAIDKGKTNKQDIATLEKALSELNQQIAAAHSAHQRAFDLLSDHPGFNQDGEVTDRQLAQETLKEIHLIHQEIRKMIRDTLHDALIVIREYKPDHPGD